MNDNSIQDIFTNASEVSFPDIEDIKTLTKESFDIWKTEYLSRLKRILSNEIDTCAKKGEYSCSFKSEPISRHRADALISAIKTEIVPLLKGYTIKSSIIEQDEQNNDDSLVVLIISVSWK